MLVLWFVLVQILAEALHGCHGVKHCAQVDKVPEIVRYFKLGLDGALVMIDFDQIVHHSGSHRQVPGYDRQITQHLRLVSQKLIRGM